MILYVAGPMRGYENFNFPLFDKVTQKLRDLGHIVFNPAEHDRCVYEDIAEWEGFPAGDVSKCPKFNLADALKWDLDKVIQSDGIVLLPGWEKSRGANHERYMAEVTGRQIFLWLDSGVTIEDPVRVRVSDQINPPGETTVTNSTTGGKKGSKLERYDLIPIEPLAEVARVYGLGARKYAERNWEKGYDWSLSYAALQRHANAFWRGENKDPEIGTLHLANVVFHCFAMMEWLKTHPELDNRPNAEGCPCGDPTHPLGGAFL